MILLALAPLALAAEVRVGLFVGANKGAEGEQPLVFATTDAERMRDLFVERGAIATADATLLLDPTLPRVTAALEQLQGRVAAAQARGDRVVSIVYWSGHGDDVGLHLGAQRLSHDALRDAVDAAAADVRLVFVDACHSGRLVRSRGGTRGPPLAFDVGLTEVSGTAILTSSAASEVAQESDEIGGGYFTWFLHSALAGAGDTDRDGVVTLNEAYAAVYAGTTIETRTAPAAQTPSFDLTLSGSGDLPLTWLDAADGALRFSGDLDGRFAVWDETRKRYVAEIDGSDSVALPIRPGLYYVHHRTPTWVEEARYVVGAGEQVTVDAVDFLSVAYDDTAARGDLDRQVRRAALPDASVSLLLGSRGFPADTALADQYVPRHTVGGVRVRLAHRSGVDGVIDVVSGAGGGALTFPELGPVDVSAGSGSLALGVGWSPDLGPVEPSVTLRGAALGVGRSFVDGPLADTRQVSWTVAPGLAAGVTVHVAHLEIGLELGAHILPVTWDDERWPTLWDGLFVVGYRL